MSTSTTKEREISDVIDLAPVQTAVEHRRPPRVVDYPAFARGIPALSQTEDTLAQAVTDRMPPPKPRVGRPPKTKAKIGVEMSEEEEASFSEESSDDADADSDDAWEPGSRKKVGKKKTKRGTSVAGVTAVASRGRRGRKKKEQLEDDDYAQPKRYKKVTDNGVVKTVPVDGSDGFRRWTKRSTRQRQTAYQEPSSSEEEGDEPGTDKPEMPQADLVPIDHIWEHRIITRAQSEAMVPGDFIPDDKLGEVALANRKAYRAAVSSRPATRSTDDAPPMPETGPGELPPPPTEEVDMDAEVDESGMPYMAMRVKWRGKAYVHATWEAMQNLTQLKSYTRVVAFFRQYDEQQEALAQVDGDDREELLVRFELVKKEYEQHCKAERIINARVIDVDALHRRHEYLVKWKGLPYRACTWETKEVVNQYGQAAFAAMAAHQKHLQASYSRPSVPAFGHRPSNLKRFETQPGYLADGRLQLRDYQLTGLNFLCNAWAQTRGVILADEMGLGKTIQCCSILGMIHMTLMVPGPFLVVVPLSTIMAWQREFKIWCPFMNVVTFVGDAESRKLCRENEFKTTVFVAGRGEKQVVPKFQVLLTTYEQVSLNEDDLRTFAWRAIVVDEAHRLKNNESVLYQTLFRFKADWRCLVTGTPMQNNIRELWALLHFIAPQTFPTAADFETKYGDPKEQISALHDVIKPYLLRRVKKDVEKSLPPKTERILRVGLAPLQRDYYRWFITRNYAELARNSKAKQSLINIMVQLKKVCNHPFLFEGARERVWPTEGYPPTSEEHIKGIVQSCGKMRLLDQLLDRLYKDDHRVLIFSQMVKMLDVVAEYLQAKRYKFQRLDGSTSADNRRKAMDNFNDGKSDDFVFILSTKAGGLGINLQTADTVIIFDSDWNPQNDLQAQARCHRIGQQKSVNIYRFVTKDTVEENIVERAKEKMILDHLIIQRLDSKGEQNTKRMLNTSTAPTGPNDFSRDELSTILKFGAQDLFKDGEGSKDDEDADDLDDILARAEEREAPASSAAPGDAFLAGFKVTEVNFDDEKGEEKEGKEAQDDASFWAAVIPEHERMQQEAARSYEILAPRRARKKGAYDAGDGEYGSAPVERFMSSKDVRTLIARIKRWPSADYTDQIIADSALQPYFPDTDAAAAAITDIITLAVSAVDTARPDKKGRIRATATYQGVTFDAVDLVNKHDDMDLIRAQIVDEKYVWPSRVAKPSWVGKMQWTSKHDTLLLLRVKDIGFVQDEASLIVDKRRWPTSFRPGSYHKRVRALLNALGRAHETVGTKRKARALQAKRDAKMGTLVVEESDADDDDVLGLADDSESETGDGDDVIGDEAPIKRRLVDRRLRDLVSVVEGLAGDALKGVKLGLAQNGPSIDGLGAWTPDALEGLVRTAGAIARVVGSRAFLPEDIPDALQYCWAHIAAQCYRQSMPEVLGWPDALRSLGDAALLVAPGDVFRGSETVDVQRTPVQPSVYGRVEPVPDVDLPSRDPEVVAGVLGFGSTRYHTGVRMVVTVDREEMLKAVEAGQE